MSLSQGRRMLRLLPQDGWLVVHLERTSLVIVGTTYIDVLV